MTEEEFKEKSFAFEKALSADPGNMDKLMSYGALLVERAEEVKGENPRVVARLLKDAEERLQDILEIDEMNIKAYAKLSKIYFIMAEDASTPAELERLYMDAALFELGAGTVNMIMGDMKSAREHFEKSFLTLKDKQKISIIPFTFMLGIDYLNQVRPDEQTFRAAKQILPSGVLSGHEEVDMIANALIYGKLIQSVKPTLTARASHRLSELIVSRRNL